MSDNRIGYSLFAGVDLPRKIADWEQIQRWNAIQPGHTIIIRPTQIGGSYVVPRSGIPTYAPTIRTKGR